MSLTRYDESRVPSLESRVSSFDSTDRRQSYRPRIVTFYRLIDKPINQLTNEVWLEGVQLSLFIRPGSESRIMHDERRMTKYKRRTTNKRGRRKRR